MIQKYKSFAINILSVKIDSKITSKNFNKTEQINGREEKTATFFSR